MSNRKPASSLDARIHEIRTKMLDALANDCDPKHAGLERRVRYADDVQGLWYARSDLMHAISESKGESVARQRMAEITDLFKELQPGGTPSSKIKLSQF